MGITMRLPAASYPFTNPFSGGARDDRERTMQLMRWAAVLMFAAGAGMCLFALATDLAAPVRLADEVLLAMVAIEGGAALYFAFARRPPALAFLLSPYLGVLCVTAAACVVATTRPTPVYYLWPLLAGAFFLRGRALAALFAFFVVAYTAALATYFPNGEKLGWWGDVVGSAAMVTLLIYTLKVQVGRAYDRLRHDALTDTLTGAANRAAFEGALEDALIHAQTAGTPCAVVSVDIDDFKQVNDNFGHAAGDRALRQIAEIVQRSVHPGATFARIGGEEFALVVPGADGEAARLIGEAVRSAIEIGMRAFEPPLTVSVGTAAYPAAGATPSSLMLASDRALYAAKAAGRNRVVAFRGDAERLAVAS